MDSDRGMVHDLPKHKLTSHWLVARLSLLALALSINPLPGALAELPMTSGSAASSSASKLTATIPFELIDNRIFLPMRLNGAGPFYFMLDSGGSNLVTNATAQKLGLTTYGAFKAGGVGENSVSAARCDIRDVQLGSFHFANQKMVTADLSELQSAMGFRKFDGIVGYELFANFTVGIDFDRREVTLTPPALSDKDATVGVAVPLRLDKTIPVVDGEVDGIPGTFCIDTGDRWSLTLFGPFVQRHGLLAKYQPELETNTGWGAGGPIPAYVTRISSLQLGGSDLRSPLTRFPVLKKGAFTRNDVSGNIGNGVLRRFNIVFEYSSRRLILRKNTNFDVTDAYDRSGMWLIQQDGHFKVFSLVKDGPAWQAGLRKGDTILAIDGHDSSQLFLPAIRDELSNPRVSRAAVTALAAGERKAFVLQLRDLIPSESSTSIGSSK